MTATRHTLVLGRESAGRGLATLPEWCRLAAAVAVLALPATGLCQEPKPAEPPAKYVTVRSAVDAAIGFYAAKDYAKGKDAVTQALALASDEREQTAIQRTMLRSYRAAPDWEPMVEALEFMVEHSEFDGERSLARRELIGFAHHRGRVDDVVKRYEDRLGRKPDDETSLVILGEIFMRLEPNARRAVAMFEKLGEVRAKAGRELTPAEAADLAREYVKDRRFREGAELFEKTAGRDPKLAAWNWKEAAAAWRKEGDRDKAIAAARSAERTGPESRDEGLAHFWHRGLADVFFEIGEFGAAIPHYERAIEKTAIDGYRKDCEQRLGEAKRRVAGS